MARHEGLLGVALLAVLAGCAAPAPVPSAASIPQAGLAWHRDLPADPEAAVALWGRLCEARGGVFVPQAERRFAVPGASVLVPGGAWCHTQSLPGALTMDGGWLRAAALADPANRTEAAAIHSFLITFSSITTPTAPGPGEIAQAIGELMRNAMARAELQGFKTLATETPPDSDAPRCARYVASLAVPRTPLAAAGGRTRRHVRLCASPDDPRRSALLIVEEMSIADDASAAARAAPMHAAIERLLGSIAFEPSSR
jgi:hypothetical protein